MHENYRGILVESESEILVLDWLFELKDRGLIHSIERSPELIISRGLGNNWIKETKLKTKSKLENKSKQLLSAHHYTPEFSVIWYAPLLADLVWSISLINHVECNAPLVGHPFPIIIPNDTGDALRENGFITYLEVKPDFDYQNMSRLFKLNQKWVWESRKMFINLLEPKKLYEKTFTPEAFLRTRKKKTEREIKWEIRTVDQYLNSIGYVHDGRNQATEVVE